MDKLSRKILRYVKRKSPVVIADAQTAFTNERAFSITIDVLINDEYICIRSIDAPPDSGMVSILAYVIMPKGNDIIEHRFSDFVHKWWPLMLSTLALIISILAIVISILTYIYK